MRGDVGETEVWRSNEDSVPPSPFFYNDEYIDEDLGWDPADLGSPTGGLQSPSILERWLIP